MRVSYGNYEGDSTSAKLIVGDKSSGLWFADFESISFSRYLGIHVPYRFADEWDLCKVIHSFQTAETPVHIRKLDTGADVSYNSGKVSYSYSPGRLDVSCSGDFTLPLILDTRAIYDFETTDRQYSIYQKDQYIVIEYLRAQSMDSPASRLGEGEYRLFIVLDTTCKIEFVKQWIEQSYELEQHRSASPDKLYVFHALTLSSVYSGEISCTFGFDLDDCILRLASTDVSADESMEFPQLREVSQKEQTAYRQAWVSYDQLHINDGLLAGYPWFFQFWARDEAIGLAPLIQQKRFDEVVPILMRQLGTLREDGRIANRHPHSDLGSADGVGLMCKRFLDVLNADSTYFSQNELEELHRTLTSGLAKIETQYLRNGLVFSSALETWMDTGEPYDVRSGFRVEIQALYLVQRELLAKVRELLGKKQMDLTQAAAKVKEALFSEVLCDGVNEDGSLDKTIRPNVFLAYYLYPELLSQTEWEATFDSCIAALWQEWGGFSTIDKSDPLYKSNYTGQTNESYHRGDVWYWVNCMSALCLHRLNSQKYGKYIWGIVGSSSTEILELGVLGAHSEVSSSAQMESHGCLSQLWSNSCFIELMHELRGK